MYPDEASYPVREYTVSKWADVSNEATMRVVLNVIHNDDADPGLNHYRLRQRGSVVKLTNAFVAANGLIMRDEIRRERHVELAQEGFQC